MVSYLLDLPEEDEEDEERPEINTPDSLWGETGITKCCLQLHSRCTLLLVTNYLPQKVFGTSGLLLILRYYYWFEQRFYWSVFIFSIKHVLNIKQNVDKESINDMHKKQLKTAVSCLCLFLTLAALFVGPLPSHDRKQRDLSDWHSGNMLRHMHVCREYRPKCRQEMQKHTYNNSLWDSF